MARNYFELPPAAVGTAPFCPGVGFVGCAVGATADFIEGYGGGTITDLAVLGISMGKRHRAIDPASKHGICPHAWCAYCGFLELHARGLPVAYGALPWSSIAQHLQNGMWVMLPGMYGKIRYVSPGSYDDTTPAGGRSDTYTGAHMITATHSTGAHIAVFDPDFGNARGTPPYSLLDAQDVAAFWSSLSYPVTYAYRAPSAIPAPSHQASVKTPSTHLYNPVTKRWVYSLKVGTVLTVGGHASVVGSKNSYPVRGPDPYVGYFVPVANVRLTT